MRRGGELMAGLLVGLAFGWLVTSPTEPAAMLERGTPIDQVERPPSSVRAPRDVTSEPTGGTSEDRDARLRGGVLHAWGRPPLPPELRPDPDVLRAELVGLTEAHVTEVDCTVYPCTATLFETADADPGLRERLLARWPAAQIQAGSSGIRRGDRSASGTWTTVALLDQPVDPRSAEGRFVFRLGRAAHHRNAAQHQALLQDTFEAAP